MRTIRCTDQAERMHESSKKETIHHEAIQNPKLQTHITPNVKPNTHVRWKIEIIDLKLVSHLAKSLQRVLSSRLLKAIDLNWLPTFLQNTSNITETFESQTTH